MIAGLPESQQRPPSILAIPTNSDLKVNSRKVARMRFPHVTISTSGRYALLGLLALFWLLSGSALQATRQLPPPAAPKNRIDLPEIFGEIVYQTEAADSNIYIIANGHRSAMSGSSTAEILQSQVETFRIGEWLINQSRISLLLPEGFFGEMPAKGGSPRTRNVLDNLTLQAALNDSSKFVNAELLLYKNYGIGLNQVEDRQLYRQTRDRLHTSLNPGTALSSANRVELAYLQKLRTITLLQAAPAVVNSAYKEGKIATPNAMLTIGLSHLDDLIAFLRAGEVNIESLHTSTVNFPARQSALELLKRQVCITVIVPRTLVNLDAKIAAIPAGR